MDANVIDFKLNKLIKIPLPLKMTLYDVHIDDMRRGWAFLGIWYGYSYGCFNLRFSFGIKK